MKIEFISLISIAAIFTGCSSGIPETIGIKDGRLADCPGRPNCVSSTAKDTVHFIEPLKYTEDINSARAVLVEIIKTHGRTKIITDTGEYIHAEFRSKIFRFTDDVEFLFDDKNKLINVRSASRIGYSDMGVNRKRIESLRSIFHQKLKLHK